MFFRNPNPSVITWHLDTADIQDFQLATRNAAWSPNRTQEEVHRQDQEDLPETVMPDNPPESTMEPLPKETPAEVASVKHFCQKIILEVRDWVGSSPPPIPVSVT